MNGYLPPPERRGRLVVAAWGRIPPTPLLRKGGGGWRHHLAAFQPPASSPAALSSTPSSPSRHSRHPHHPSFPPSPSSVIPAIPIIRHSRPHSVIPAPTPSFPRKRESTPRPIATPNPTGVLDSGLRRNDGGAAAGMTDRMAGMMMGMAEMMGVRKGTSRPMVAQAAAPLSQKGGWGDSPPARSFRRRRNNGGRCVGGVDSRFRGNDGVGAGMTNRGRE